MDLPVKNIVSDVDLKPSDALLPLYESVVNAIVSLMKTKDMPEEKKKIQIQIERGELPQNVEFSHTKTINSIKVIDNGEGFTDKNLNSYKTAYSRENKEFGCKGIGRFTILAGFEKISIKSNYTQSEKWHYRELTFDPINEVNIVKEEETQKTERKTIVELINCYNPIIKEYTAVDVNFIAEALMQHCLIYYLCKNLPRIEIIDKETNEGSIVNDLYSALSTEREKPFSVRNYSFNCYITKTKKVNNRKNHYLHYCANSRVVGENRNIGKINTIFSYPLQKDNNLYFLDAYIVSDLLDEKVYNARNGFRIPIEKEVGMFANNGEITFQEIEEEIAKVLTSQYDEFVKETQDRNIKEVQDYIHKKAPRYKRYANREDIINQIPPNLSDEKKEEFLYKIAYKERQTIEGNINKFIDNKVISKETIEEIKIQLKEKSAFDADNLSDYMLRRKAIIQIFKQFLDADKEGKYKLEEDIHNLIFPMGVTNENIDYESHNLWLLDERFATYSFIASDIPITSISQNKSRLEPDILMVEQPQMFDNRISFAPEKSGEVSSMVIFEFKRPGETAHQKKKNDYMWLFHDLVKKYFDAFIYGQDKKTYKGRPIVLFKNTPKFGYVIVDVIPPLLASYNEDNGFRKTPFGTYFWINSDLNLHIEVITFDQLIASVEKRHAPFFDKLFEGK